MEEASWGLSPFSTASSTGPLVSPGGPTSPSQPEQAGALGERQTAHAMSVISNPGLTARLASRRGGKCKVLCSISSLSLCQSPVHVA